MKKNELHEQVMKKLDDLDKKVDAVRSTDIPGIKTDLAVLRERVDTKIQDLEKRTSWSNRCYTALGGAIAILLAKFTGGHS